MLKRYCLHLPKYLCSTNYKGERFFWKVIGLVIVLWHQHFLIMFRTGFKENMVSCCTYLPLQKGRWLRGNDIRIGSRCSFRPSGRRQNNLKLHLFTFSFTYTGLSAHRNFFFLPVPMSLPLNHLPYFAVQTTKVKVLFCFLFWKMKGKINGCPVGYQLFFCFLCFYDQQKKCFSSLRMDQSASLFTSWKEALIYI